MSVLKPLGSSQPASVYVAEGGDTFSFMHLPPNNVAVGVHDSVTSLNNRKQASPVSCKIRESK